MKQITVIFMPHPPIIIPQIGQGEGVLANKTTQGMNQLSKMIGELKPKTIIFFTPHGNSFSNGTCLLYDEVLYGDFSEFGFRELKFKKRVNQLLTEEIFNELERADINAVLMDTGLGKYYDADISLDNGVMVPMHFIEQYYSNYDIVHITPGSTSLEENYNIGRLIGEIISTKNESIVVLCSGDLSHALKEEGPYHYHPYGDIFDDKICTAIVDKNPIPLMKIDNDELNAAAQCGLRSFLAGFGALDGRGYKSQLLNYEGPFGVGYVTGFLQTDNAQVGSLLKEIKKGKENLYKEKISKEDNYVKLARMSIEHYVRNHRKLNFNQVKNEFTKEFKDIGVKSRGGVFVSIHSQGKLRGCIGTIEEVQDCIIEEIIYNAISACAEDPRFDPVEEKELIQLDVNVDVLMKPERIYIKSELNILRFGVIVEKGKKRGLLLPNLKEVHSIEEQVQIAMKKAGIKEERDMKLYRFEVIRH